MRDKNARAVLNHEFIAEIATRKKATRVKLAESRERDDSHWLDTIIREAGAVGADDPTATLLPHDSVDSQIDEQITTGEKSAKDAASQGRTRTEGRKRSLRELLEAEGGDDSAPDPNEKGDGGAAPPAAPELDIAAFSREAARIVDHVEDLIDLKGTVLRRIINFVTKTYGQKTSDELTSTLESDFNISLKRPEDREDANDVVGRNAAGAGPELGG